MSEKEEVMHNNELVNMVRKEEACGVKKAVKDDGEGERG
jgi:hypothetical protein